MYKDSSLKKYLDDLAAKLPAPGGGSAAALNAALGVSLISMVINFTLGKPKYARYEKELKSLLGHSEALRKKFLELVDLDVTAYKSGNIQEALDVPFMLCRLCFEAMKLCPPLITRGNANLISDVAVAAVMLESAFSSAYFNVMINLNYLPDKKRSALIKSELGLKQKTVRKIRLETEERIGRIVRSSEG